MILSVVKRRRSSSFFFSSCSARILLVASIRTFTSALEPSSILLGCLATFYFILFFLSFFVFFFFYAAFLQTVSSRDRTLRTENRTVQRQAACKGKAMPERFSSFFLFSVPIALLSGHREQRVRDRVLIGHASFPSAFDPVLFSAICCLFFNPYLADLIHSHSLYLSLFSPLHLFAVF